MTSDTALGQLDETTRQQLEELPPSSKYIFSTLYEADGLLTRQQLEYQTLLPTTTTKRALRQLHDVGLVSCSPKPSNPHASEWWVDF